MWRIDGNWLGDKMNNKGFMMAEVIVVSAIILTFLAGLYLSYNKLFSAYKIRINYYDSVTLYRLVYYRDSLIETEKMNNLLADAKSNITNIFNTNYQITRLSDMDNAFIIYNNQKKIASNVLESLNVNPTFNDYINYISTGVNFNSTNYILVLESCTTADECKYAYLEVNDGYET